MGSLSRGMSDSYHGVYEMVRESVWPDSQIVRRFCQVVGVICSLLVELFGLNQFWLSEKGYKKTTERTFCSISPEN